MNNNVGATGAVIAYRLSFDNPGPNHGQLQPPTRAGGNVYRYPDGDCTHGGLSSKHRVLFDSDPGHETSALAKASCVRIVEHFGYYIAYPANQKKPGAFGGNYLSFEFSHASKVYPFPLKIHDRYGDGSERD